MQTKRTFLKVCAATAVFPAISALAQRPGRGDPKRMVDRQMEVLKERLKLDADQEAKVRAILEENAEKMAALREKMPAPGSGERPPREVMEQMREIRASTHDKLAKVLNEDQMKEYRKIEQERGRRMGAAGRRKGPPQ